MDQNNDYDFRQNISDYTENCPDKEVRIINAAIQIFSEKGFESTKTKEIAEKAGIAEGTIFRYFPSKGAILEKMVPLMIKVIQPKLEKPIRDILEEKKDSTVDEILSVILLDRLSIMHKNRLFFKSVLPEVVHRPKLLKQLNDSLVPAIKMYVSQLLVAAQRRGEISNDMTADILFNQLFGFIISYSLFTGSMDNAQNDVRMFLNFAMKGWKNDAHH